ncbi:MAG TPA: hypothetical protein DCW35_02220 [Polynucleobacter sp.]|nr:hypothetical protein [Polynucleobacter sp.]
MLGTVIVYLLHFIIPLPDYLQIHGLIPEWSGLLIGLTSMIQIGIAMWIDSRYDEKIWRNYGFTIWYPIAFCCT